MNTHLLNVPDDGSRSLCHTIYRNVCFASQLLIVLIVLIVTPYAVVLVLCALASILTVVGVLVMSAILLFNESEKSL